MEVDHDDRNPSVVTPISKLQCPYLRLTRGVGGMSNATGTAPSKAPTTLGGVASSDRIEKFYPRSASIANMANTMTQIQLEMKLRGHIQAAQGGDRERESRLINRIGQIRREFPNGLAAVPERIRTVMREAVEWLRSVGRVTDFKNPDARYWISQRGGAPRW